MKKTVSNPITLISNLDLHVTEGTDGNQYCYCTLRLGSDVFSSDDADYKIKLLKARLHVELSGYEMMPGTKFGENVLDPVFVKTSVSENMESRESGIDFNLSGGGGASSNGQVGGDASARAGVNHKRESSRKVVEKSEAERRLHRVLSRGDNYWDICDLNDQGNAIHLRDGTYLNNDQLCGITEVHGSNRVAVTGTVMVRRSDIEFQKSGMEIPFGKSKNKEKLMKLITAETLAKISDASFSVKGFAAISMVEVIDEES